MRMSEGGGPYDDESYLAHCRELLIRRLEAAALRKQARSRWWRWLRQLLRLFNPYR